MPVADLSLPARLLAGGGPGCPDPRVLQALGMPLIGQFDPAFTAVMDDVMELARQTFITSNTRCFPVSGLAAAGVEALLNTLVEEDDRIAVGGGPAFVAETADMATRYGARVEPLGQGDDPLAEGTTLVVVPLVDRETARRLDVQRLAAVCHAVGAHLIVEASLGLGCIEFRMSDWGLDACVAGVDFGVGAPSGLALVTYSSVLEARMRARRSPPRTSYLDLLQLQAYWSAERLNHHTAPTSLIYGLREALRLLQHEGCDRRWARHQRVGGAMRAGLETLGLNVGGDLPYTIVGWPSGQDEATARRALLDHFGVYVRLVAHNTWCFGLLGADARLDAALRVLTAVEQVVHGTGAVSAALDANDRFGE